MGAFMASYAGRDTAAGTRLDWWLDRLADRPAFAVTADDVDELMGVLGASEGRTWNAKSRGMRSATTCNRYLTVLGSVYKWARRRRIAPRRFGSPTRGVERFPEAQHRVGMVQ